MIGTKIGLLMSDPKPQTSLTVFVYVGWPVAWTCSPKLGNCPVFQVRVRFPPENAPHNCPKRGSPRPKPGGRNESEPVLAKVKLAPIAKDGGRV
jgi:hypothetical protein